MYGVHTTGVYCRPSCSSRQPRRENVRIFAAATDAELAGFRPCKRCEPQKSATEAAPHGAAESLVRRACAYIDANPQRTVRLAEIARAAHASPGHLQRTFTRVLGISPRAYAEAKRQDRLRQALRQGRRGVHTVSSAVYDAGYGSTRPVYGPVDAAAPLGMPPATYQAGGAGAVIRYAIIDAPLGQVMVAATSRGVCSVRIGDDRAATGSRTQSEFPAGTDRGCARIGRSLGRGHSWHARRSGGSRCVPFAARRTRYRISAAGVGGPASDPGRRDAVLHRGRRDDRRAHEAHERLRAPARRIRWRSSCPATVSFVPAARSPAIAGASSANAHCSLRSVPSVPTDHCTKRSSVLRSNVTRIIPPQCALLSCVILSCNDPRQPTPRALFPLGGRLGRGRDTVWPGA